MILDTTCEMVMATKIVPQKNIASIETVYEKGVLQAVAYKNGEKVSQCALQTAEAPSVIALKAESATLCADGRDLCFIDVCVTDANGIAIVDYDGELTYERDCRLMYRLYGCF